MAQSSVQMHLPFYLGVNGEVKPSKPQSAQSSFEIRQKYFTLQMKNGECLQYE